MHHGSRGVDLQTSPEGVDGLVGILAVVVRQVVSRYFAYNLHKVVYRCCRLLATLRLLFIHSITLYSTHSFTY